MATSKRGYVIAASVAAVVAGGVVLFLFSPGTLGGLFSTADKINDVPNNTTVATSTGEPPKMLLFVLKGDEDSSDRVTQYDANNNQPIPISSNEHIRFDSPDYRTAESMKVVARDMDSGAIMLLRKSYDVNNEFFVNLDKGSYQLQVQATWFEVGSHIYKFDIVVS
ncbi:MAG TPA: hypothetical protein VHL10_06210 [Nitrososphaera sp.]|nr:hypothetical protein [Nitrososphaera sp.]